MYILLCNTYHTNTFNPLFADPYSQNAGRRAMQDFGPRPRQQQQQQQQSMLSLSGASAASDFPQHQQLLQRRASPAHPQQQSMNLPYKSASFGGWDAPSNAYGRYSGGGGGAMADARRGGGAAYLGNNANSYANSNRRRDARTLRRGRRLSRRGEREIDPFGQGGGKGVLLLQARPNPLGFIDKLARMSMALKCSSLCASLQNPLDREHKADKYVCGKKHFCCKVQKYTTRTSLLPVWES